MGDFQVLTAVRGHLMNKDVSPRVHLALPPKAMYPLILVELEEMWSHLSLKPDVKRKVIQARIKFKVSVYSQSPGMEEAAQLSSKVRKVLEGETLWMSGIMEGGKTITLRFLACVTENSVNVHKGGQQNRIIHHFYDSIIRG